MGKGRRKVGLGIHSGSPGPAVQKLAKQAQCSQGLNCSGQSSLAKLAHKALSTERRSRRKVDLRMPIGSSDPVAVHVRTRIAARKDACHRTTNAGGVPISLSAQVEVRRDHAAQSARLSQGLNCLRPTPSLTKQSKQIRSPKWFNCLRPTPSLTKQSKQIRSPKWSQKPRTLSRKTVLTG